MSLVGGAFFTKSFGHNCILPSKNILLDFCQKISEQFEAFGSKPKLLNVKKNEIIRFESILIFYDALNEGVLFKETLPPSRGEKNCWKACPYRSPDEKWTEGLRRTRKTLLSITTVGRQTFAEKIFGLALLVANVWLRLSIESSFERFYENFCSYPAGF